MVIKTPISCSLSNSYLLVANYFLAVTSKLLATSNSQVTARK